jgi:hypothetical protein
MTGSGVRQGDHFLYSIGRFLQAMGSRPQSMVIDGTTLVTDACNHRIVVFGTDGTFIET